MINFYSKRVLANLQKRKVLNNPTEYFSCRQMIIRNQTRCEQNLGTNMERMAPKYYQTPFFN
jgi:hypothetical protein